MIDEFELTAFILLSFYDLIILQFYLEKSVHFNQFFVSFLGIFLYKAKFLVLLFNALQCSFFALEAVCVLRGAEYFTTARETTNNIIILE